MSPRPRRALLALAAAGSVLLSGITLAGPAEAVSQRATLSIAPTLSENVRFASAAAVTPIKIGRRIDLQVKDGKRWKTLDTVKQDQYGVVSFAAKVKRTKKAKSSATYERRQFRVRARSSGSLKERVSPSKKVKVMLDPKVYYKVVRASVQHTDEASMVANGCGIGAGFSATRKTSSGLGRSESGRPRWRAQRLGNNTIRAEIAPRLGTRWTQDLTGCRWPAPAPAEPCTTTRTDTPTGDGKEPLGVRVSIPRSGTYGSVFFYTRGLNVGFPNADDSVCNVPWMRGGDIGVKLTTKSVPRKTLLGKRAFTVVNQGQTSWTTNVVNNKPADLNLHWTESITLQRVDASGRTLR